jgi:hypothetical protein
VFEALSATVNVGVEPVALLEAPVTTMTEPAGAATVVVITKEVEVVTAFLYVAAPMVFWVLEA